MDVGYGHNDKATQSVASRRGALLVQINLCKSLATCHTQHLSKSWFDHAMVCNLQALGFERANVLLLGTYTRELCYARQHIHRTMKLNNT